MSSGPFTPAILLSLVLVFPLQPSGPPGPPAPGPIRLGSGGWVGDTITRTLRSSRPSGVQAIEWTVRTVGYCGAGATIGMPNGLVVAADTIGLRATNTACDSVRYRAVAFSRRGGLSSRPDSAHVEWIERRRLAPPGPIVIDSLLPELTIGSALVGDSIITTVAWPVLAVTPDSIIGYVGALIHDCLPGSRGCGWYRMRLPSTAVGVQFAQPLPYAGASWTVPVMVCAHVPGRSTCGHGRAPEVVVWPRA